MRTPLPRLPRPGARIRALDASIVGFCVKRTGRSDWRTGRKCKKCQADPHVLRLQEKKGVGSASTASTTPEKLPLPQTGQEGARLATAAPRSGQEAFGVEAGSRAVAMRRRCGGWEEAFPNFSFMESDDLRIQNLFVEFASLGHCLRTADTQCMHRVLRKTATKNPQSRRALLYVSCTGESEEEGDEEPREQRPGSNAAEAESYR